MSAVDALTRHDRVLLIRKALEQHAHLAPELQVALEHAQLLDYRGKQQATAEALARLDALAEELGSTSWTLVQYANLEGPYTKIKVYETHQHLYESRRNLPRARTPEWMEIAQKVWAIAEDCPVNLRYAIQRRAAANKAEVPA